MSAAAATHLCALARGPARMSDHHVAEYGVPRDNRACPVDEREPRKRPFKGLAAQCPHCRLVIPLEGHVYGGTSSGKRYVRCDCGGRFKVLLSHGGDTTPPCRPKHP